MTVEEACELVWERGKTRPADNTTCTVYFTRDGDEHLARMFAVHLKALGGFEIPVPRGRAFAVKLRALLEYGCGDDES